MTATEVLDRYRRVARGILLFYFGPASCIASTRVTIEVLKRFGVSAEPLAVKFLAQCHARKTAYQSGFTDEELKGAKSQSPAPGHQHEGWNGHLVAIAEDGPVYYIIDPSFDQIAIPGIRIPPNILIFPGDAAVPPREMLAELKIETDDGDMLHVSYRPLGDSSYLTMPAWQTDHLQYAIATIVAAMEKGPG